MNARSLKSVLVLLAQILGPFGQTWVFYKFGWVFYKFTENGEFFNRWFLLLRGKNRDACFWSSSVLPPNLEMWPALFQGQGVLSVRLFWLSFRGRGFFPRKTTQDQESEGLWHECHKISGLGILKFPSLPKRGNMINCFFMSFITGRVFGAE